MTPEQRQVIETLREEGYAVILWNPKELGKAPPGKVEDRSVELGREVIRDLS